MRRARRFELGQRVGRARRRALEAALIVGSTLAICAAAASADPASLSIPPGCALGIAGPALRAAASVHEARDAAFAALAAERLPIALSAELSWSGSRVREISDEWLRGELRGAWVAGLVGRSGGRIDALVCGPEVEPRSLGRLERGTRRAWPRAFDRRRGCALGLAGVDLDPGVRVRSARRDALEMLARERGADVRHALSVHGGRSVQRAHAVRATAEARAATERIEADLAEERWLDEQGRGPLGIPGVLYLQLCLPATGA